VIIGLFVEKLRTFVESKQNPLALTGPLLLALALTLLWGLSKEVFWALPTAGLVGLAFTWVGGRVLFWISQGLVLAALLATLFLDPFDFYWQMGFAASLSLSLVVTALSQNDVVTNATSMQSVLQEQSEDIEKANAILISLQLQLQEKEAYLSIARDEFLHLQQQQKSWSDAVFEERRIAAKALEKLEDQVLEAVDSPEYRRLNGAYTQLKDQFKEKDATLTTTRKDLFLEQERANALSKELEEYKLYGVPSEIATLQNHCAEIEAHYSEKITRLKMEIQALEAIVNKS
jgi:hypothetical protein